MRHLIKNLALAAALVLACAAQATTPPTVTLVYVSNLPDIDSSPGLAEVAGLLQTLRSEGKEVLLLHGGDSLAPSTLASFDRGAHMIALLNELDPLAMAAAKREFAFGEDQLTLRSYEAAFPIVINNLLDPLTSENLAGLTDRAEVQVGDRRLCATASVSLELREAYMPRRVQALDPVEATRRTAKDLRDSGCDIVVALFGSVDPDQESLLERGLVDLLISAESHADQGVKPSGEGAWVTLKATEATAVVAEISLGKSAPCAVCPTQLIPLGTAPTDATMLARLDSYRKKLAEILAMPVGVTDTALDTRRSAVRTGESAFGNLVADALRDFIDADVALLNSGGIRGNRQYPANSVLTRGDIQSELPFRNRVVRLELTGSQLRAALENGLAGYEDQTGAFPQISGMTVRFNPTNPVGQRVLEVRIGGRPLRDDQRYSLATLDFLARGGDGYQALAGATPLRSSLNALLWESVRSYIGTRGRVAPRIDGRLIHVQP